MNQKANNSLKKHMEISSGKVLTADQLYLLDYVICNV